MAKVSKQSIKRIADKYREQGLSDQEITIKLLRRKDAVGKNIQTAMDRAQAAGIENPQESVMAIFGVNPKRAKGSRIAGEANKNPSISDTVKSQLASVGMGLADVGAGIIQGNKYAADKINQGVNSILGTDLDTNALERYNQEYEQANDALDGMRTQGGRSGGDWYRGGTEIAATTPFFFGGGGTTLGARALDQGVRGAAVGAARYADNEDARAYNMAGGAIGGAAGQAAGEVVASGLGKIATKAINAKRGNITPKAREVLDAGEKFGVRTSVGDAGQGVFARKAEANLERIPVVGMADYREAQHSEAKAAVADISNRLKSAMSDIEYKALPKLKAAADSGDRNAARVLNVVETAGDDSGKVLQASAEMRAWREGQIANKMYDKVGEAVAKQSDSIVAPTNTNNVLNAKIADEAASLAPDEQLVKDLDAIKTRLSDPDIVKDFSNMRLLRTQLGDMTEKYMRGTNPNKSAAKFFGDLRKAVDDDIDDFVTRSGSPEVKTAYKRADDYYKRIMSKRDRAVAKAMSSDTPDEIYKTFIKTGKSDRAANFYRNLDEKGQAALRHQMAEEAIGKAINESNGNFSPLNFAGEFERMAEPYERIFKGDDKKQMDGFVKLMRHIERAGQYRENPPTGNRLIEWGLAGTAITSPAIALKAGSVSFLAKTMLTTKAGKNILLAANKLPPERQAALDNLIQKAAKLAASQGSQTGSSVADTKVREDSEVLTPTF